VTYGGYAISDFLSLVRIHAAFFLSLGFSNHIRHCFSPPLFSGGSSATGTPVGVAGSSDDPDAAVDLETPKSEEPGPIAPADAPAVPQLTPAELALAEEVLIRSVAQRWVRLCAHPQPNRDRFLDAAPYAAAEAVQVLFQFTVPGSRPQYTLAFRTLCTLTIVRLLSGVEIAASTAVLLLERYFPDLAAAAKKVSSLL
jgi:hypothetical protein